MSSITPIAQPRSPAHEQPSKPSSHTLDNIPGVKRVLQGARHTTIAALNTIVKRAHFGGLVFPPGEGGEMQEGKDGHFETDQQGGKPDFYVCVADP